MYSRLQSMKLPWDLMGSSMATSSNQCSLFGSRLSELVAKLVPQSLIVSGLTMVRAWRMAGITQDHIEDTCVMNIVMDRVMVLLTVDTDLLIVPVLGSPDEAGHDL